MVHRMWMTPCCSKFCLHILGQTDAFKILRGCINEIDNMNRAEKKQYLTDKVVSMVKNVTPGGYLKVRSILIL
jgi:hypothetical protein